MISASTAVTEINDPGRCVLAIDVGIDQGFGACR
jgi:hypothetical protein